MIKCINDCDEPLEYYMTIYNTWLKTYKWQTERACEPYFFGKSARRCEQILFINKTVAALMSIDYNRSSRYDEHKYIIDIGDFIINPDVDASIVFNILFQTFHNYDGVAICSSMGTHEWYTNAMKEFKAIDIILNSKLYHVIYLKEYASYKFTNNIVLNIGNNQNIRKAAILRLKDEHYYSKCGTKRNDVAIEQKIMTNFILLLFNRPIIYQSSRHCDDIFFDLTINNLQYSMCICSDCNSNNQQACQAARLRRLNKLSQIKTQPYWEDEGLYYMVYGIYVPTNIINNRDGAKCTTCKGSLYYHGLQTGDKYHRGLHSVDHNFSKWLNSFPSVLVKKQGIPEPTERIIPLLQFCKPSVESIITVPDWEPMTDDEDASNSVKSGYIYLIQEREHVIANNKTYKFGKTKQHPNNYIDRVKSGYKKGSNIILIRYCSPDTVSEIETKIRKSFQTHPEFSQHTDGHEHFNGCYKQMLKIINSIMDSYE